MRQAHILSLDNFPLPVPSSDALARLVYLVGPARGGTSIIHEAMDLHPNTLVLPTSHFLDHPWRYRNRVHDRLWRIIMRLPSFYDPRGVLETLEPETATALRRYITQTLRDKRFAPLYQLYPLVYSLDSRNQKDPRQITCWHDKSNSRRDIDLVKKYLPRARFVFVTRDPRSVVLSHARRAQIRASEDRSSALDQLEIINAGMYWRSMMQVLIRFAAKHPGSTLQVRFEDFLRRPVDTLNRIFTFTVGEPIHADVLERGLQRLRGGASNRKDERYCGISSAPMDRWRTDMSASDVELIGALTWPTARKLGYDVSPPEDHLQAAKALMRIRGRREQIRAIAKYAALTLRERFG